MASTPTRREGTDDRSLLGLFGAIATRGHDEAVRQLDASPDLATRTIELASGGHFLDAIRHHVYRGDTALHVAAAAHQRDAVETLLARGAVVRARNRRGAEPLHYAADGSPGAPWWDPDGQADVIARLVRAGADPDALDNSGVAPLHRAVRTRSARAVQALIEHGADPLLRNKSGSTPLHLAVQNTGRSNSGSDPAKDEQTRVITVLLQHGARPTDTDAKGKTVAAAATSGWIQELLRTA